LLAEDAEHLFGREDFTTDGQRLFFTLAAWTSTVWVLDLTH